MGKLLKTKPIRFLAGLFLVGFSGCGYHFSQALKPEFQPAKEQGIFIPVFSNKTDEVGVEPIFTNALVRELQSRGEIVITDSKHAAIELAGVINKITYDGKAFTLPGYKGLIASRAIPYQVEVVVNISFVLFDSKTRKVLWSGNYTGSRPVITPVNRTYDFQAPSSIGPYTQSVVQSEYPVIARIIMRDVYDNMIEAL